MTQLDDPETEAPEDTRAGLRAPLEVRRTGDDSPARDVWRYVRRMSGWHQVGLSALAVLTAILGLAPIELQRRLVDDAIVSGSADMLLMLGAIYGGVILAQAILKFAFRLYQGWVSESAILYTRQHLMRLLCARESVQGGRAVSVINAEVDKLGGFVGQGPSDAFANASLLVGILAYMIVIEPTIAGFAIGVLLPQLVLTPLIQRKLNRLMQARLSYLRGLGDIVASGDACRGDGLGPTLKKIYGNRLRHQAWKFFLKSTLNLINAAGPLAVLLVGGWLALNGETTVGTILAFVSGFERLVAPARELIAFYRQAAQAGVQHDMIARWM